MGPRQARSLHKAVAGEHHLCTAHAYQGRGILWHVLIAWLVIASGLVGGLLAFMAAFAGGWPAFAACAILTPMTAAVMARLRGRHWLVAFIAGAVVAAVVGYAGVAGYES